MRKLDREFEDWIRKQHMDRCTECKKEGKGKLMDSEFVAVLLFREFYNQR